MCMYIYREREIHTIWLSNANGTWPLQKGDVWWYTNFSEIWLSIVIVVMSSYQMAYSLVYFYRLLSQLWTSISSEEAYKLHTMAMGGTHVVNPNGYGLWYWIAQNKTSDMYRYAHAPRYTYVYIYKCMYIHMK